MVNGTRPEWLAGNDFIMIHLDLIDLGLSLEAALLLHRIHFRSGGNGWWYVTKAQMQGDTRLSERKLDRAISELREHGMVAWERKDAQNPTLRWRVVWAEVGEPTNRPSREGQNVPHQKDETSSSSTKNSKNNPPSPPAGGDAPDGARGGQQQGGPDLDAEFADWWQVYPKKVDKKKAREAFAKARKRADYPVLQSGLVAYVKALQVDGKVTVTKSHAEHDQPEKLEVRIVGDAKVLNPTTWLNGDRWEDDHGTAAPAASESGGDDGWMHRNRDQ